MYETSSLGNCVIGYFSCACNSEVSMTDPFFFWKIHKKRRKGWYFKK